MTNSTEPMMGRITTTASHSTRDIPDCFHTSSGAVRMATRDQIRAANHATVNNPTISSANASDTIGPSVSSLSTLLDETELGGPFERVAATRGSQLQVHVLQATPDRTLAHEKLVGQLHDRRTVGKALEQVELFL